MSARPRIVVRDCPDLLTRPVEIHAEPCAHCPSAHHPPDPEALDMRSWPRHLQVAAAFPCGWRPTKLCKGYCDSIGMTEAETRRSEERMSTGNEPKLDVDDMVGNMHFRMGGVFSLFGRSVRSYTPDHILELRDKLWELFPFLKALGRLALEHPERMRELWAEALQEPMPFGGAPIGLPKDGEAKPE